MRYLVTKVLGNFPEIFLLLISNLISPWSENILCMTCIPLNVLMLVFMAQNMICLCKRSMST